jgi:hypothetical protein
LSKPEPPNFGPQWFPHIQRAEELFGLTIARDLLQSLLEMERDKKNGVRGKTSWEYGKMGRSREGREKKVDVTSNEVTIL